MDLTAGERDAMRQRADLAGCAIVLLLLGAGPARPVASGEACLALPDGLSGQ